MKTLLLENVHPDADEVLRRIPGIEIERAGHALDAGELKARLAGVQLLGIRSRTKITDDILAAAPDLLAIGCFCIGTNQVDLDAAARRGVAVFNAPFANTRSVAELTLASTVMLMRGIPQKLAAIRRGEWQKTATGAHEVRAKKLGIIGYGNIGSQLSVLASGHGMHVYFYDTEPKLAHGNARPVASLDELLALSDVVTLHVPSTPQTRMMMDAAAIAKMKPGSFLINHARGDLVDVDALAAALHSGHLAGAAVDVFPVEPASKEEEFVSPLRACDNALLTPHIGGSTEEAQAAIGMDAGMKLARYAVSGGSAKSVNFPELEAGDLAAGRSRILALHGNAPGYLSALTRIVSEAGLNIAAQYLNTAGGLGYVSTDVEGAVPDGVLDQLRRAPGTVRIRTIAS
ncbi:phosphoglycerate dehydrogenase [Hyphobacterium indicum]|uniref:phosphoglycerate dehydrogenase n=1 Tax=Hyphobacterium indicum TaxID=2162714 RepID=UPI000D65AD9A|nr:phosphoglycerate dehydrogenase [Hyphobacterium indicum]